MSAWRDDPGLQHLFASPPSETTPALLELSARQAARRRPADVLGQYRRDACVRPAAVDLRTLHRLDGITLDAAHEYEAVVLSPIAPLGVCTSVATGSQDRVMSTTRGSEVVSDPTNVLAVECAQRLRERPNDAVRLCTNHQTLRMQRYPPLPGLSPHFRMFAMVEAGPAQPEHGFEVAAIVRCAAVIDRVFDGVTTMGATFARRHVVFFHAPRQEVLVRRAMEAMRRALPHLEISEQPLDSRYYDGVRVMLGSTTPAGERVEVADIGLVDWMPKLTANARHRVVTSGVGPVMLLERFGG